MPRPAPRSPTRSSTVAAPALAGGEYAHTGARLGRAVLAYVAAVVLVITLEPFAFRRPVAVELTWWAADGPWRGWFDVLANVALFLPLGFLAALTRSAGDRGARGAARARVAFAGGALLSAAVECVQVLEPGRYPSPTDVLTNAPGRRARRAGCTGAPSATSAPTRRCGAARARSCR
jgi:VanZ family protein